MWKRASLSVTLAARSLGQATASATREPARVSLEGLAKAYSAMQLPVPPASAALVVYTSGESSEIHGQTVPSRFVGFVLKQEKDGVVVQAGTFKQLYKEGDFKPVEKPADVDGTTRSVFDGGPFGNDSDHTSDDDGLVVAIQCELTGHHDVAVALFNRLRRADMQLLGKLAIRTWKNEILLPGSDRKALLEKIAAALATQGDKTVQDHLADLVRPPGELPKDPLEAAVVGMADACMTKSPFSNQLEATDVNAEGVWRHRADKDDKNYLMIRRDIVKALPYLLAHMDDKTVPRSFAQGFNNFQPAILTEGTLCQMVLEELTQGNSLFGTATEELRAKVQAIVNEASKGEEAWLLTHLREPEKESGLQPLLLETLTAKYPKDLVTLFAQSLAAKSPNGLSQLETALNASSVPVEDRVPLFVEAAGSPAAFNRWADRADMGMQMEMIQHAGNRDESAENPARRIAFCRKYLGDDRVRRISDDPKMFDGPCAGGGYDVTRVGDLAAMELSYLLDMPGDPRPERITTTIKVTPVPPDEKPNELPTSAEWNALRERVREALAAYDKGEGKQPSAGK